MSDLEVVQDNTGLVVREIPNAVRRALETIGMLAEGHVVGYITEHHIVDTGRLRNSITHMVMEDYVAVGTNVEYALFVHEGTHKSSGRPFLTSPVAFHQAEYRKVLEDEMGKS